MPKVIAQARRLGARPRASLGHALSSLASSCGKVVMSTWEACRGRGQDTQDRHTAATPSGLKPS